MPKITELKDSGKRTEFETGAVRDIQTGKGRCDLLPLDIIADIYVYLEEDANQKIKPAKYDLKTINKFIETGEITTLYPLFLNDYRQNEDYEYERIGIETLLLEVAEHFESGAIKYGDRNWEKGIPVERYIDSAVRHYLKWMRGDTDEPHEKAFRWNILCCMWTCIHHPELNSYLKEVE